MPGVGDGTKPIVGVYIRLPVSDVDRLRDKPDVLSKFDHRVSLADGRGLDLGRAWEALAVLIDGGVRLPERGPTLGELPLPDCDARAAWSYVDAVRVPVVAEALAAVCRQFAKLYGGDGEDTDPYMSDGRTAGYRGNRDYLLKKLELLAKHYGHAAVAGEAMVVRIGERL